MMNKGDKVLIKAEVVEEQTVKKTEFVSVKIASRDNPIWVLKDELKAETE